MHDEKINWPPRLAESHHGPQGWPVHVVNNAARILRRKAGEPCAYCGTPMARSGKLRATRDHVFPKSLGNRLSDLNGFNKAIVCAPCNISKRDNDIIVWWWRLQNGNDGRAPRVLKFIEGLWLQGVLPEFSSRQYKEAKALFGDGRG